MATYFTDFSEFASGTTPTGWARVFSGYGETILVNSSSELEITSGGELLIAYPPTPVPSGIIESFARVKTSALSSYSFGFGIAELGLSSTRRSVTVNSRSGPERFSIFKTLTRQSETPVSLPIAGVWYNILYRINAGTVQAWIWYDGDTPKTSADTPTITYADVDDFTGLFFGIMNDGISGTVVTCSAFGIGTDGDQAPQSAPSAGVSSTIGFNIEDLVFGVEAEAENKATASASFDIEDLIFGVAAGSASNVSASASFDLSDLIFSGVAEAASNSTATVSFDINDLVFGVVAEATNNATSTASFDISDLVFNVNAGSTINTSSNIGFDISDLVFSASVSVATSSTASVSFDISNLVFGVISESTRNSTASIGFDIDALIFSSSAIVAIDSTASISFDINDLVFNSAVVALANPPVNPYRIPGINLYRAATKLIATDKLDWFTFASRERNALGNWITTYSAPIEIRGSVQPVEIRSYKQLGLDMSKRYVTLFTDHNAKHVARQSAPDRFEWNGAIWEAIGGDDWFKQDGWREVVLVCIGSSEVLS